MNQIKVKMKDVEMDGVYVCDEYGDFEKVDLSKIDNAKGKDIAIMSFKLTSSDEVVGIYENTTLLCSPEVYNEKDSNNHDYSFSIHRNKANDLTDYFRVYDAPLADEGISYSDNNLELTFEVKEYLDLYALSNGFSINTNADGDFDVEITSLL